MKAILHLDDANTFIRKTRLIMMLEHAQLKDDLEIIIASHMTRKKRKIGIFKNSYKYF